MATVFNASDPALVAWVAGTAKNSSQINAIPNFFSKSKFGNTNYIRDAAQVIVVAAIVSVVLRTYSRRRTKTPWKADDWCAVLSMLFLVVNQILFIVIDYLGVESFSFLEKPDKQERARLAQIVIGLKLSLAFEVMYLISIFLVKFSMLFLYQRFAKQTSGIRRYLLATQVICSLTFAVCILSLFLSCIPISHFWSLHGSPRQCSRRTLLVYTSGVSNIITNALVLAVPVPLLLRANLTFKQRSGLLVLYVFGAFVIVASALRFATQLLDVSVPQAIGWSQMEIALALILACAPMAVKLLLMPLLSPQRERDRILAASARKTASPPDDGTSEVMRRILSVPVPGMGGGGGGTAGQVAYAAGERVEPKKKQQPSRAPLSVDTALAGGEAPAIRTARELGSPDYHKLRLIRREENGRSVWEVRPISADEAVELGDATMSPMLVRSSLSMRRA